MTDIYRAVYFGDHERLEKLLKRTNVNDGQLLLIASSRGHLSCVKLLIAAGSDLNAIDCTGLTSLMNAVYNSHPAVVEVLLNAGADHQTSKCRMTALDMAIGMESEKMIDMLKSHGIRIERFERFKRAVVDAVTRVQPIEIANICADYI